MALDTTAYKNTLTAELARVTAELETLGIHNKENEKDWIATPEPEEEVSEADENVAADHAEELEERTAVLADLEHQYNDIMRALSKIEAGTYGTCEISGEAIEQDRLGANPAARTCKQHMNEESLLPQ